MLELMHGSQGIMVDNLPNLRVEPEGEAWLSTIIPMATMRQLIYIPPFIGQWLLSIETNRLHSNNTKLTDSDKEPSSLHYLLNSLTKGVVVDYE